MRGPCWTLNNATEGVGRAFPQHEKMRDGYNYDSPNSVHRLPYDALPDFEPDFDTVVIHTQAKLTDLLSSAPIKNTGYLVSERFRTLLLEFALPQHRFYPVPATHRGKLIDGYFWLQLPEPKLPLSEAITVEEAESVIASASELAALDLLRLYRPTRFGYCFISDRLRRAMEARKITGVRFGTAKLFRSGSLQE